MNNAQIRWTEDMNEIAGLKDKWLKLEVTVHHRTVFSKYDWVVSWYKHYRGNGFERYGEPLLGTAWIGDELVGIAPLMIRKGTLGKIPVRRIDFAGSVFQAGEFLVPDDKPEIIEYFIKSIMDNIEVDVVCLNSFDAKSEKFKFLHDAVRSRGLRVEKTNYFYAAVDLKDGYQAYYDSMGRNFKRNQKRFEEKISDMGQWQIEVVKVANNREELTPFLKRMFAVYDNSWKFKAGGQLAEHHRKFYGEVACRFAKRRNLFLSFLTIGSRDAAFFLSIAENDFLYDVFLSYDEYFRELRPGEFLINETIKKLPDNGIHTLISHGAHEYKRRWASDFIPQTMVFIFLSGLRAELSRFVKFYALPIVEGMKETIYSKLSSVSKQTGKTSVSTKNRKTESVKKQSGNKW